MLGFVEFLFFLSLAWIFYATIGYGVLVALIARFVRRPVKTKAIYPHISLIIAAYNQAEVIKSKLQNSLDLDYPPEKLEIIVASDSSTDGTDQIVHRFAGQGIRLFRMAERSGKTAALNQAVKLAQGEILVISDADSNYNPDALKKLVRNFADPVVGAVSGLEVRLPDRQGRGVGEGFYARLDNWIKLSEGTIGSMVMVNGGFFAIRCHLYPVLDSHLVHDSIVPCLLQLQGFRTVYEPQAYSTEVYSLDTKGDFVRRQRTVLQAFSSYLHIAQALNPLRSGLFALQVLSHRFSRWFVFPCLLLAFVTNLALSWNSPFYSGLLWLQLAAYIFALVGFILDRAAIHLKPFYLPYYFVYVHLAAFGAILRALAGKRQAQWEPADKIFSG